MNKSLLLFITLLLLSVVSTVGKSSSKIEDLLSRYPLTHDARAQLLREFETRIDEAATRRDNLISECPICMQEYADLDAFGEEGELAALKCGHIVCKACNDNGQLRTCPLCRAAKKITSKITCSQYRDLVCINDPEYGERRTRKVLEAEEDASRRALWRLLQNGIFSNQAKISSPLGFQAKISSTLGFVAIPPGTFQMGSPVSEEGRDGCEVQHTVTLTTAFELKKTPVTEKEWCELMGNNPSYIFMNRPAEESADACPVQQVSWFDAVAYCNKMSIRAKLVPYYSLANVKGTPGTPGYSCVVTVNPDGKTGYRLPTEAEWEYAARAGSTAARYGELDLIAWYYSNSDYCTHSVRQKQANAFGLFDMLGNVYEWTDNWYGDYAVGVSDDPQGGPLTGGGRVIRGGFYVSNARLVRAANRYNAGPSHRDRGIGFRPARSLCAP